MSQDSPSPSEPSDQDVQSQDAQNQDNSEELPIDQLSSDVEPRSLAEPQFELAEQPLLQKRWGVQSSVKIQSIKALRATIQALERVVERLEAPEPKPTETALPPVSNSDRGNLAPAFSTDALFSKFQTLWSQIQTQGQRFQSWWNNRLRRIRRRLPRAVNRTLASNRALTGAIGGILIIVLWTASTLLPGQPKPTPVAIAPPAIPDPATPLIVTPSSPPPVEVSPPSSAPSPPDPSPTLAPTPFPAPAPTPTPVPLQLTPEQALIAAIQDQVAEISDQYVNGLIRSVQANFRSSLLTITLGEGWYRLGDSQQNKLANEMLRRAQTLDFVKLELADGENVLLARSPVVGSEMVILQRTNELRKSV